MNLFYNNLEENVMNTILEKHKWIKYTIGAFVISLGVLIIILACINMGALANTINIVMSCALMLCGLALMLMSILSETHKGFTMSLIISSAILTAGIILLIARFGIGFTIPNTLLVYILSVFTLVFGCVSLFKGISLAVFKEKRLLIFLMFVVALAAIVAGILGLVFVEDLAVAAFVILGILVLTVGVLIVVFSALSDKKKSNQE